MDIILKIEKHYKEKIINLESLDTKSVNNKESRINTFHTSNEDELLEPYFFAFDSILLILCFKLIDIF